MVSGRGYRFTGEIRILSASPDKAGAGIATAEHVSVLSPTNAPKPVAASNARSPQWTILTGARTDEVIGAKRKGAWTKRPATWAEIEKVDGKPVWVIPRERMTARKPHRVPLSAKALALLGKRRSDNAPLFKVSSANAMLNTLKALDSRRQRLHSARLSVELRGLGRRGDQLPPRCHQALHCPRQADED